LEAAYAVQNSWPTIAAVDEIATTRPERCARITGSTARVTFHRAEQRRLHLRPEILRTDLLKNAA
jgi:hypothetical protein